MVGNSFKSDIAPVLQIGGYGAYIPFHTTWQHEQTEAIRRGMETIDGGNIVPCIFVIPVYGGHMPELAKRKFNDVVSQDHRPAVLVAVYGNRAFENALTDLDAFVRERGFNPVAAGAFVCEHSYSTEDTPIAAGRPDADDMKAAEEFGRRVGEKLASGNFSSVDAGALKDEPSPEESVKRFSVFVREFRASQNTRSRISERKNILTSTCWRIPVSQPTRNITDRRWHLRRR